MIFSLPPALKLTASNVMSDNAPVAYSWGNVDALHKWIEAMNKKAIDNALGIEGSKKYPLIWLEEGWRAKEHVPGLKFENCNFWISCNSSIETLNENRVPNFNLLYEVANAFIAEVRKVITIEHKSIGYTERSNLSTGSGEAHTLDVWDAVILKMNLEIPTNCIKKLYSPQGQ